MKVSFIIRTLNEGITIEEVLQRISALDDDYIKEVIIVDSGSSDNTIEVAKTYCAKIIKIPNGNWSWGRALNVGMNEAAGDYFVIISGHCFISRKDFLRVGIQTLNEADASAAYGRQLPIPYLDPFEEYELKNWYPDLKFYVMDFKKLLKGLGVGISNSCAIVKREAWEKIRFNEDVESLEDGIWAFHIVHAGYRLVYSSEFSVFHSHPLDLNYIYRKWYWRNYEILKFRYNFIWKYNTGICQSLKKQLRRIFIKEVLFIKSIIEKKMIKKVAGKYNFISDRHINIFLRLKNMALINSTVDFFSDKKMSYWSDEILWPVAKYQEKLSDIKISLSTDYSFLTGIR